MTTKPRPSGHADVRPFARDVAKALIHDLAQALGRVADDNNRADLKDKALRQVSASRDDTRRFWAKVAIGPPQCCWRWMGCKRSGYGIFGIGRTEVYAHRVAYTLAHGAIPARLSVLHSCDQRDCQNPDHLRVGTDADNARDRVARNRQPRGARHANAKLGDHHVRAIHASADTNEALATRFGVSRRTVAMIRAGRTWKHLLSSRRTDE